MVIQFPLFITNCFKTFLNKIHIHSPRGKHDNFIVLVLPYVHTALDIQKHSKLFVKNITLLTVIWYLVLGNFQPF